MMITAIFMIIIGVFLVIGLVISVNYGVTMIRRSQLKSSGKQETAIIRGKQLGRWVTYSRLENMEGISDQQIILKLEVHPVAGVPYIAYDKFMAKKADLKRLNEGCLIQVYVDSRDPKKIVCDPKTVSASMDAPAAVEINGNRGDIAMADIANQVALGGDLPDTQQLLDALKSQSIAAVPQDGLKNKTE
jgi:hypothetical protein